MYVIKPRVKAAFNGAIAELEKANVTPTPDEVVWLYFLAEKMCTPERQYVSDFMDMPVRVGELWLYPLTVQAEIWLESYAHDWWRRDSYMYMLATAYAMAHAREARFFERLTHKGLAKIKIRSWAFFNVKVSLKSLKVAIIRLLNPTLTDYDHVEVNDEKLADVEAAQWGDIIALLCGSYPGTKPADYLIMNARDVTNLLAKAPVPTAFGMSRPKHDDSSTAAFWEFRKTIQYLIRKYKGGI